MKIGLVLLVLNSCLGIRVTYVGKNDHKIFFHTATNFELLSKSIRKTNYLLFVCKLYLGHEQ
jgi:hypothetical protein